MCIEIVAESKHHTEGVSLKMTAEVSRQTGTMTVSEDLEDWNDRYVSTLMLACTVSYHQPRRSERRILPNLELRIKFHDSH